MNSIGIGNGGGSTIFASVSFPSRTSERLETDLEEKVGGSSDGENRDTFEPIESMNDRLREDRPACNDLRDCEAGSIIEADRAGAAVAASAAGGCGDLKECIEPAGARRGVWNVTVSEAFTGIGAADWETSPSGRILEEEKIDMEIVADLR
jgi:hypothetical protein